jgi:hypothetical protein
VAGHFVEDILDMSSSHPRNEPRQLGCQNLQSGHVSGPHLIYWFA